MAKKRINKNAYMDREFGVILEDIRSDFKVFGETLLEVKKKGDDTFEVVGELKEDVAILKEDVSILKEDVSILKEDVSILKEDMVFVKEELGLIRNELKEKVSRDEFALLEKRVLSLEKTARTRS